MRRWLAAAALLTVVVVRSQLVGAQTIEARLAYTLPAFSQEGREVAFSADGLLVATSSPDSAVRLWRVADGKLERTLRHPEGVTSISFSRDAQWLASASYDGNVRVWRMSDGSLVRTMTGHAGTVWSVAFSPDGQTIASSGEDKVVKLWRSADGVMTEKSGSPPHSAQCG